MPPLKVIFAGAGEFGLPTLRALIDAKFDLVQVISQPDRPAGRGRTMTPTPVAAFASSATLPLLKTANINSESLSVADVMVVIAFGQKIAAPVVDHPRLGSINLHASILPKYRGAAPINWAIIRGETIAGNSIIRLAQKMDAGAILAQSELPIGEIETAGELHDRLAADGAPLMLRVLDDLLAGRATETPQDESQATIAPKLNRAAATIDWNCPADQIARQIRGLYPWPGCTVELHNDADQTKTSLTLVRARVSKSSSSAPSSAAPGTATATGIVAGRGTVVEILEIKPQGKRPMVLTAYQNGHPWQNLRAVSPAMA